MLECPKENSVVYGKGMKKRLNLWVHEITTYKKKGEVDGTVARSKISPSSRIRKASHSY